MLVRRRVKYTISYETEIVYDDEDEDACRAALANIVTPKAKEHTYVEGSFLIMSLDRSHPIPPLELLAEQAE